MSQFPYAIDSDTDLPPVFDNIVEAGAEAINAVRDAVFNVENNIGVGAAGTTSSIAARLGISIAEDGSIKASALTSLGLVTLPITNNQISDIAEITESKLKLDHRTADLFNYIQNLQTGINTSLGWIAATGVKLEPHLLGAFYKHNLKQIDVSDNSVEYFKNKFGTFRDNSNSFTVLNDLNSEFLNHQFSDGTPSTTEVVTTISGQTYPASYGHHASGIFINTDRFATIPQTAEDLQQLVEFIDSASIFLLGTRIQNLYSNGISRSSRSSSLLEDGYGQSLISWTTATTYLLGTGISSYPVDSIDTGDDIIELFPESAELSSNIFDAKFAVVKIGDIIRVNYGTVETSFIIKEKKYIQSGGNKKFVVRINGKNLFYTTSARVRIDKPLFNNQKHGVLTVATSNSPISSIPSSLIVGSPRGAQITGVGFNPDQFDATHYMLYLIIYPDGNPSNGFTILPGIDVTGNRGATPGKYTLSSIVQATNNAFRATGYNYRFIAYQYNGEFGIMLADAYNNVSFSIISGTLSVSGGYDQTATETSYPNNVIDLFADTGMTAMDALGFGPAKSDFASPPYVSSYSATEMAQFPTKIFVPLRRNNYYVNGVEKEKLNLESQTIDSYGDGYWSATVISKTTYPNPAGRVKTTYRVMQDLSTSNLQKGKTIVVQNAGNGTLVDFGRFIIEEVLFNIDCVNNIFYTDITVYDAVHAKGFSPQTTLNIGSTVHLYFNSDSVAFNQESATDFTSASSFKRFFEVYIDQNAHTFTHERARFSNTGINISVNGETLTGNSILKNMDIVRVSSKLRGYQFSSINKITLVIDSLNIITGAIQGYLCYDSGTSFSRKGPYTAGRLGQTIRFYDETNSDYIDINFDIALFISSIISTQKIDVQVFPTLSLDEEIMLIGVCEYDDILSSVVNVTDYRQFGNTSEKDLSTSALNYISLPQRLLHSNGVIRGFNLFDGSSPLNEQVFLSGGVAFINGKIIYVNAQPANFSFLKEIYNSVQYDINWVLCVNELGELHSLPLLDYDASIPTPSVPTRVVNVLNLVDNTTYALDAISFSNLINSRKDLLPIYLVRSNTSAGSPPTISLTAIDCRKYINDSDGNLPIKFTNAESQGNFKSFESIISWLKFNGAHNNIAYIKGLDATSGEVNSAVTLDFSGLVTIDGGHDATIIFNDLVTLGSNLSIENTDITFSGGVAVVDGASNLTFKNCNITITVPADQPTGNVLFNFVDGNYITIDGCVINITYAIDFNSTAAYRGAAFALTNVGNFKVLNSTIGTTFAVTINVPTSTPGTVFELNNTNGVIIENCIFTGLYNKLIDITDSNYLKFNRSVVTSSYNPNAGSSPDQYDGLYTYDTTDFVNSGRGYIYADVTSSLTDIYIDDVMFNYMPAVASNDRHSFINFELSSANAILVNVGITNCKFNNLNFGGTIEDHRAAISIINTATGGTVTSFQPMIANINISNNACNRIQSIIISSVTQTVNDVPGKMEYPGLFAQNCVIRDNICGTIGYWVSAGYKVTALIPNVTLFSDKSGGLLIENNSCHYIATMDSRGQYFLVSKLSGDTVNMCAYPSGYVIITKNRVNWIHVGIAYEEYSSLTITNNVLSAYDFAYVTNSGHAGSNVIYNPAFPLVQISNGYAIFVSSNKIVATAPSSSVMGTGNNSACVISNNTIESGYWLTPILTSFTYKYNFGYIYCQSSCNITGNVCKGVNETLGLGSLIMLGGRNNIVTNNRVYRSGTSVFAYVTFTNLELPTPWDGAESTGTICDNYFDSPYINDVLNPETLVSLTAICTKAVRWTVERNINQSVILSLPITNSHYFDPTDGSMVPITSGYKVSSFGVNSNILHIEDSAVAATRFVRWQENLDKFIPSGARIIRTKILIKQLSASALASGTFTNSIVSFEENNQYLTDIAAMTNATPSDPGVATTISATNITSAQLNTGAAELVLLSLTDVQQNAFVSRSGYGFAANVSFTFERNATTFEAVVSPFMVTYRW